jgi:hypothetical protein
MILLGILAAFSPGFGRNLKRRPSYLKRFWSSVFVTASSASGKTKQKKAQGKK